MHVVARAVRRLRRLQHPSGSWSDFMVAVGPSDGWLTGYAGVALAMAAAHPVLDPAVRAEAAVGADAAARWLLDNPGGGGAYGYHARVQPDADSTAWAIRLLALRGRPVPAAALAFLVEHETRVGYRTYRNQEVAGRWAEPTPDVTSAALLARYEAGALEPAGLAEAFERLVRPARELSGRWRSQWWAEDGYPTAIAMEAWVAAGRPGDPLSPQPPREPVTSFGRALWLSVAVLSGGEDAAGLDALLAAEDPAGGWAGDAELLVPGPRGGGVTERSRDARGIFTTATALRALLAVSGSTPVRFGAERPVREVVRDAAGSGYDRLLGELSRDLGVPRDVVLPVFAELTRESLAATAPWPSVQLSALAGGLPLELSVHSSRPALRYTVEVGDPVLPPYQRAVSGLTAIGRAAALLGYGAQWAGLAPAIATLVDPALPMGEGCRFWVWAGVDTDRDGGAVLKIYLSALHRDVPGGLERVLGALAALGVPGDSAAAEAITGMEQVGYCHELGLAIGPGGRVGAKVYYELPSWRPDQVAGLLAYAGLPADPGAVAPDIPGVMTPELAATQRAGISLRIGLPSGSVREVTVTSAFMRPMIGHAEIARRVGGWLGGIGDRSAYDAVVARLLPGWPERGGLLHSLFTRTAAPSGTSSAVYLRPAYPTG